ncbi:MAG TPA: hypothetical protein VKK79_06925 [Candidatus Lokiarchaeia archaeon]|nr:hypothetical protein [Candidatus Lokiarchaeia archaeon]
MSSSFATAVSLEYLIIIHKESNGIIYFLSAPGIEVDPSFLDGFKRAVEFDEIEMPGAEGDISQATYKGKFAVVRSGKFEFVVIIINKTPDRFTREALHSFGIKFSSRWARELKVLYSDLNGDVSVFKQKTSMAGNVDDLVEECFHLSVAMPHKLGMPSFKMKGFQKTIWSIAEELARGKQYVLLGELLSAAREKTGKQESAIAAEIFGLIQKAAIIPLKMEELQKIL